MVDIVPELLALIEKDYEEGMKNSSVLKKIIEKIENKTATYLDADEYASEVAAVLAKAYENITEDKLPDGKMYYNIAYRLLDPTLRRAFDDVADITVKVQ